MEIYLFVEEDGTISGTSFTEEANTVKVIVSEDHPVILSFGKYRYIDGELVEDLDLVLEEVKHSKDLELNKACSESILAGFEHEIDGIVYHFSYDLEAQINFGDAITALSKELLEDVGWTVKRDGEYARIRLNKELMEDISLTILLHKERKISRYRDELLPLVRAAETIEEVEAITWDYVPEEGESG